MFGELTNRMVDEHDQGIFGYAVIEKVDDVEYESVFSQHYIELLGPVACPMWRLLSWLGLVAAVAVMAGSFAAGIRWGGRNSVGLWAWGAALTCSYWNMIIHAQVIDFFIGEMCFSYVLYPIFCVLLVRAGAWARLKWDMRAARMGLR